MANAATLLYAMGFFAMLLGNILFLTSVWHYSILRAGLAVTPGPLVVAIVSGPAGKLAATLRIPEDPAYGIRSVRLRPCLVRRKGGPASRLSERMATWNPRGRTRDRDDVPGIRARLQYRVSTTNALRSEALSTRLRAKSVVRSAWHCWS